MKNLLKKTKLYKVYHNNNTIQEIKIRQIELDEKLNQVLQLQNQIAQVDSKLDAVRAEFNYKLHIINNLASENNFADIFHDTIKNSKWFNLPLSLSSGAIGYPFAYILYRVLDDIQPQRILETGLGQSSKIISQYVKHNKKVRYDVVEHDKNWVDFFQKSYNTKEFQHFHILSNYKRKYNNTELNAYKGFASEFKDMKFDFICIDGPIGCNQEYSRMDILDIIPDCLEKQFIILLDDADRIGEQRTIELLESNLKEHEIAFFSNTLYTGKTTAYICVSEDLEFLCHI